MSGGRLWLAIVLGPLAWLAYLETAYALVPLACRHPTAGTIGLPLAALLGLGLWAVAAVIGWRAWRQLRGVSATATTPAARAHFMTMTGLGTTAYFLLVLVAGIIPLFFLAPCQ